MMQRSLSRLAHCALIVVAALLSGCGTISSNTVDLSVQLTNRIKDIEASHRGFVNAYFDEQVSRVNRFMDEKWIPLFLQNFLGTSNIIGDIAKPAAVSDSTRKALADAAALYLSDQSEGAKMADEIVAGLNKSRVQDAIVVDQVVGKYVADDRVSAAKTHLLALLQTDTPARMILGFAQEANKQIAVRRDSLVSPIEQARKKALDDIASAYHDFYAGQGVITGRLEAAARRDAEQAKLIDSITGEGSAAKLTDRLNGFAADFNKAFSKLDKAYESAKAGPAAKYLDTFKTELDQALQRNNLK